MRPPAGTAFRPRRDTPPESGNSHGKSCKGVQDDEKGGRCFRNVLGAVRLYAIHRPFLPCADQKPDWHHFPGRPGAPQPSPGPAGRRGALCSVWTDRSASLGRQATRRPGARDLRLPLVAPHLRLINDDRCGGILTPPIAASPYPKGATAKQTRLAESILCATT